MASDEAKELMEKDDRPTCDCGKPATVRMRDVTEVSTWEDGSWQQGDFMSGFDDEYVCYYCDNCYDGL